MAIESHNQYRASLIRQEPASLFLLLVVACSWQRTDPDLWGHLRAGQAMLAGHSLVRTDPYSYTALGQPWRNHEWLTQLIMASAYDYLGVIGLKLWKLACMAATILLMAAGLAETGAAPGLQLSLMFAGVIAMIPFIQFRPQLFTYAFLAGLMALLVRDTYRGRAPLWLVVPMMALWANLHGGFIAGLAAFSIYAVISSLQSVIETQRLSRTGYLSVLTLAAITATLLTPYVLDTWIVVAHALRDPLSRTAINDWRPLLSHFVVQWRQSPSGVIYYLCAFALMAAAAASCIFARSAKDLPLVGVAILMCIAAFVSVRNLPFAMITCTAPAAHHLSRGVPRWRSGDPARDIKYTRPVTRFGTVKLVAVVSALSLALFDGVVSSRLKMDEAYPSGAVAFIEDRGLHGNILDDFDWGEYLIWHLPQSKVFIDGRYDTVYPQSIIQEYINFYFNLPGAIRVVNGHPHDLVLLPPAAPANVLLRTIGWKLVYHDSTANLFARPGAVVPPLTAHPVTLLPSPNSQYFP